MKVYIVNWFSAEEYSPQGGVEKVFDTKEKAEAFVKEHKSLVLDEDLENYEYGRMISGYIEEKEVE